MKRLLIICLVGAAVAAFLAPAMAAASSSTCQAYKAQTCSLQDQSTGAVQANTASPTTTVAGSAGSLPFTGLDLMLLVGGGASLILAGAIVRRASRKLD